MTWFQPGLLQRLWVHSEVQKYLVEVAIPSQYVRLLENFCNVFRCSDDIQRLRAHLESERLVCPSDVVAVSHPTD